MTQALQKGREGWIFKIPWKPLGIEGPMVQLMLDVESHSVAQETKIINIVTEYRLHI